MILNLCLILGGKVCVFLVPLFCSLVCLFFMPVPGWLLYYGPVVESELDIMVLVAVFSFPKVLNVFICLLVD